MAMPAQFLEKAQEFETKGAEEVLRWALKTYHPRIALASSFGAEDVVLIDMMVKINPNARIFTLDTGRLNQETYDVMDRIREKYRIKIEVMFPKADAVEQMVRAKGMNLFYDSIENTVGSGGRKKPCPRSSAQSASSSATPCTSSPTFSTLKTVPSAFFSTSQLQNAGQKSNP